MVMKKEDLEKHLDNILTDGLIKEAEQDNADFEKALREISDEEFNKIVSPQLPTGHVYGGEKFFSYDLSSLKKVGSNARYLRKCKDEKECMLQLQRLREKLLIARMEKESVVSEKKNIASPAIIDGFDVWDVSLKELGDKLTLLERNYESSLARPETSMSEENGWTLAMAYLRLHRKKDAIEVLKTLKKRAGNTPFGIRCARLLEILY